MKTLPEEILQLVCLNLRATASRNLVNERVKRRALLDFSLASKTYHRIASPALYYFLDFRPRASFLRLLLRTLIECPELARFVVRLRFNVWGLYDVDTTHETLEPATAEQRSRYSAITSRLPLSIDFRHRLTSELQKGLEGAELALLLLLCTRLKLLDFTAGDRVEDSMAMAAVSECLHTLSRHSMDADHDPGSEDLELPLAKVQEIRAEHEDGLEDSTDLSQLSPLLQLPSLETLRCMMLSCDSGVRTLSSPTLRRLYLQHATVDSAALSALLLACPKLETLSIHWGTATVEANPIQWDEFGDVLRRDGSNLTSLTLRTEGGVTGLDDDSLALPLGRLKELAKLRRLAVPFHALFQQTGDESGDEDGDQVSQNLRYLVEILPVSLRTFRIGHSAVEDEDLELHDTQVSELMMDHHTFTELDTIEIGRPEPFSLDLTDSSWNEDKSNKFWMILRRIQKA